MEVDGRADPALYAAAADLLHGHLEREVANEEWVQAVEFDEELTRWYVRFTCVGRDAATIYFDLHQRSLHYELYFLPAPSDDRSGLWQFLLRCNHELYGARFSIGPDGDVYVTGRVLLEHLDVAELDRTIGVLYAATERWFQTAVSIAFR